MFATRIAIAASSAAVLTVLGAGVASASTVPVQPGDTMSGIAASHGVSLGALEAANPQVTDPNLIYVGDTITVPDNGMGSAPVSAPSAPSGGGGGGGDLSSVPGVPASFAACVAFRESTDGQLSSNVYGIIPASGYDVSGMSVDQQKQVFSQLYAADGTSPWSPYDGC